MIAELKLLSIYTSSLMTPVERTKSFIAVSQPVRGTR